jgi:hypothetical protein
MDLIGPGLGSVTDFCGHGTKFSGSIKGEEFLNQLSNYQVLKKDSVPRSWLVKQSDKKPNTPHLFF